MFSSGLSYTFAAIMSKRKTEKEAAEQGWEVNEFPAGLVSNNFSIWINCNVL